MAEYTANLSGVSAESGSGSVAGYLEGQTSYAGNGGGVVGKASGLDAQSVEWGETIVISSGGGVLVRSVPRLVRG